MRGCRRATRTAVFHPGAQRRIVLATNVAETSLTVPRIHYVVDPGLARVKRYSPRQKLDRLHIEPVSQASANQRKGRCGRIAPRHLLPAVSRKPISSRGRAFTDPEIRRAALAGVILRMLSLGLGDIEDFPFLEPPDARAIADGWQQLAETGRGRLSTSDWPDAADRDRPHDGAAAGGREAGADAGGRAGARLPARDAGDRQRSWASRIRASARPKRARRPTTRTRSSPMRDRSSSASSSCGRPIAPRTRT